MTVGWSKTAIFSAFGRYIFGTFRGKAKISDPKIDDLE